MVVIDRSELFCTPAMGNGERAQAAGIQGLASRIGRSPGFGHALGPASGHAPGHVTGHAPRRVAGHKNSIVTRRLFPYNQDKRSMARIIE
ncbi:hypothetical protein BK138_24535 [Paenibacillus rhizosphaerae]|uniref:Uncharacterized protein n=1 Tax=Paenibacillus rhizosphaerae TaxID=297318 RepID=A0A1R1EJJ2_9BACL|nr:hypothetical protein BK138_24535 [Paenibacillus rhizosphaerae]